MSFGIFLIDKVGVVGTNQFDAILFGQLDEHAVGLLLHGEGLAVGANRRVGHLVALQLKIIVVAEHALMPLDGFAGSGYVVVQNLARHLTGNTRRTDDESFMVAFQVGAVGTRSHVETVDPRTADKLDEVFIALVVLGKHD